MAFLRASSPHTHNPNTTHRVMREVLLATLPGVAVLTWFFGLGTLSNILIACLFGLGLEAAVLKMRGRPIAFYLKDLSALVTAVLLAIALPPASSWWLIGVGMIASIVVAKHLYGGLGYNPFNPAMVGYVVLLISYPQYMTLWLAPENLSVQGAIFDITTLFELVFGGLASTTMDGLTAATPLDVFKQTAGLTAQDIYAQKAIFSQGLFAGAGYEWVNIAFLLGGLYLLMRKVFTWHAPITMLVTLALFATVFYDAGSSNSGGSPLLHLFSGATMLGAFFIVTDPVSSATSNRGRLIYGALIGALVYIIRVWGNYPDAVAFAVLLMNFAAPFIDYYTVPRTYGHKKAQRATHTGGQ
ncbi:electron transport complex subunit RsxD [Marinagarivorans algicola]|uniref:electron transport complex subunit RsxD n=1 Tax=Marinagarivorans algicola TaxID=1513270 RepID=UPI0006B93A71|nr:electron transport complex subunit RsxD [Marinagarivorans algicola]